MQCKWWNALIIIIINCLFYRCTNCVLKFPIVLFADALTATRASGARTKTSTVGNVEESAAVAAAVPEFGIRESPVHLAPPHPWCMLDILLRGWRCRGHLENFAGLPSPGFNTEFH
ncbi:hypothetical protein C0J52_24522 [Blattella germanica]|nr:hypothetical protein C0J52_24522 [Blattella germanica]